MWRGGEEVCGGEGERYVEVRGACEVRERGMWR